MRMKNPRVDGDKLQAARLAKFLELIS